MTNGLGNAQARSILLEIDYTDTTGERQQVVKTIQLNQSIDSNSTLRTGGFNRQQNSSLGITPWIVLAIILAAGIIYNKVSKKNNWKNLAIILAIVTVLFIVAVFMLSSNLIAIVAVSIISIALVVWYFFQDQIKEKFAKKGKK